MTSSCKKYTRKITDFFTNTPEQINFTKKVYKGMLYFLRLNFLLEIAFFIGIKETDT